MRATALIVGLAALVSVPAVATATTVIYSTFGPGDSYADGAGWTVAGTGGPFGYQAKACSFAVSGGDHLLGTIDVGISAYSEGPILVSLRDDNASLPGSILESFTLTPASGIVSLPSVSRPLLRDGLSYWVTLEPGAAGSNVAWCDSDPTVYGPSANDRGAGWVPLSSGFGLPAYRVTGEPVSAAVPEPITMISLLGGLTALGTYLRRRVA